MKKGFFLLLIALAFNSVQAQFERKDNLAKFGVITTGEYRQKLAVPDFEATELTIQFEFFSSEEETYKQTVNQKIERYVTALMLDTLFFPMEKKLAPVFFENAIKNFAESYQYVRFRLGEDVPPYSISTQIEIDTTFKNYIQLSCLSAIYTAGAHPFLANEFWLIDKAAGAIIDWHQLLKNKEKFENVAEKYFRKVDGLKKKDPILTWNSTQNLSDEELAKMTKNHTLPIYNFKEGGFELSKHFYIHPKEIELIYLPYEARDWARGTISVLIPKNKIKKYINFNW